MFDLSFLFPFFLLLSLCRAFNFRYVCVLSRDFVCYSHTPAYCLFKGCGFTNTTDGRADPIRASTIVSAWHRLYIRICRRGSGYSGAFPWRSTYTLIIVHEWRWSMASRDVRVRFRPTVVRVRVSEPAIRAVVRVAAENPQLKYPCAYLPRDWQALFFLSRRSTFTSAKIAWGIEPQDDLL